MPKLDTLPATASVQEMQRNYRRLLDRVKQSRRPLFVLRNNSPEVVIVDVRSWEELVARAVKREEEEALQAIRSFFREAQRNKLKILRGSLVDLMK